MDISILIALMIGTTIGVCLGYITERRARIRFEKVKWLSQYMLHMHIHSDINNYLEGGERHHLLSALDHISAAVNANPISKRVIDIKSKR